MSRTAVRRCVVAALAAATLAGGVGSVASPVAATTPAPIPTLTVTITSQVVKVHTLLHAGAVRYNVVTPAGSHSLQILRLKQGYTPADADKDFGGAFGGNVAAVDRIDKNVLFYGGVPTTPSHPGSMIVSL